MKSFLIAATAWSMALSAGAATLNPQVADVSFLVGDWTSGDGVVAEGGGAATGASHITLVANGAALLRQDRTNIFDSGGKPRGSFAQVMLIYPEGGTLRGDYSDGTHVIHYVHADVIPGRSVTFTSAKQAGAPEFRLTYTLTAPNSLAVAFGMTPPGSADFSPIASGTLRKAR